MTLDAVPPPTVGLTSTLQIRGAPPLSQVTAYLAFAPAQVPILGSNAELLIDPGFAPFATVTTNVWGEADHLVGVPNLPSFAGLTVYLQAATVTSQGLVGSHALEVRICP